MADNNTAIRMVGPDGVARLIPPEQVDNARAAGFKVTAPVQFPDHGTRWIPEDQLDSARQAGGLVRPGPHVKVLPQNYGPTPTNQQDQGVFSGMVNEGKSMFEGVKNLVTAQSPTGNPISDMMEGAKDLYQSGKDTVQKIGSDVSQGNLGEAAEDLPFVGSRDIMDMVKQGKMKEAMGHALVRTILLGAPELLGNKAASAVEGVAPSSTEIAGQSVPVLAGEKQGASGLSRKVAESTVPDVESFKNTKQFPALKSAAGNIATDATQKGVQDLGVPTALPKVSSLGEGAQTLHNAASSVYQSLDQMAGGTPNPALQELKTSVAKYFGGKDFESIPDANKAAAQNVLDGMAKEQGIDLNEGGPFTQLRQQRTAIAKQLSRATGDQAMALSQQLRDVDGKIDALFDQGGQASGQRELYQAAKRNYAKASAMEDVQAVWDKNLKGIPENVQQNPGVLQHPAYLNGQGFIDGLKALGEKRLKQALGDQYDGVYQIGQIASTPRGSQWLENIADRMKFYRGVAMGTGALAAGTTGSLHPLVAGATGAIAAGQIPKAVDLAARVMTDPNSASRLARAFHRGASAATVAAVLDRQLAGTNTQPTESAGTQ